jgi:hypothetical protein
VKIPKITTMSRVLMVFPNTGETEERDLFRAISLHIGLHVSNLHFLFPWQTRYRKLLAGECAVQRIWEILELVWLASERVHDFYGRWCGIVIGVIESDAHYHRGGLEFRGGECNEYSGELGLDKEPSAAAIFLAEGPIFCYFALKLNPRNARICILHSLASNTGFEIQEKLCTIREVELTDLACQV